MSTYQEFTRKNRAFIIIQIIAIASFGAIVLIKGVIRPLSLNLSQTESFLLGTSPNFFAAIAISMLAFTYISYFMYRHKTKNIIRNAAIVSIAFSSIGLCIWEYLQYFLWSYPVDYYDNLATIIGSLLSGVVFYCIRNKFTTTNLA